MRNFTKRFVPFFIISVLFLFTGCKNTNKQYRENTTKISKQNSTDTISIEIDYGKVRKTREIVAKWKNGITVLDALNSIAEVKMKQVGDYNFVVSIDGIKGERGKMGWYYLLNGKKPSKLAVSTYIKRGDTIKWYYTKDVCSSKVDGK